MLMTSTIRLCLYVCVYQNKVLHQHIAHARISSKQMPAATQELGYITESSLFH